MTVKISRRGFLGASAAAVATPALAQVGSDEIETGDFPRAAVQHNVSSFRTLHWEPHFDNLSKGAILVDITSRALHFWDKGGVYRLFPTSVPLSEDLTRRGRTSIVRKVVGPEWRPTPAMKIRNPEWPDYVGPGPDNPLGTHAMYLSWTYYRIHGTHDTRKIGRKSSNGCIGLYNENIAELFGMAQIGTPVLVI